jgi:hypothetical protein
MIDRAIKAVDEELLSEEGLMTIGDTLPPHIQHWGRLGSSLRDRAMVTVLPALLGTPAIAMLAVAAPIYLSVQGYGCVVLITFCVSVVLITGLVRYGVGGSDGYCRTIRASVF